MSDLIRPLSEACYWASQSFPGKGAIRQRLTVLSEIQWWKPEQSRAFQLEKLQRHPSPGHRRFRVVRRAAAADAGPAPGLSGRPDLPAHRPAHPQLLGNVMRQFPQEQWFQVVREHKACLVVRVVTPGGPLSPGDQYLIIELIRQHSGFDYAIAFEHLPDMPDGRWRPAGSACASAVPLWERVFVDLNSMRMDDDSPSCDSSAARHRRGIHGD